MEHLAHTGSYAFHNTKAHGTLFQVIRHLTTDTGRYSFQVLAEDFKSRKQADLPIQWFAVWRESEDRVRLIRTGVRVPVNNVYPKDFVEEKVPEFMVPDEDAPKIKAILNSANRKVNREVVKILQDENPAKYFARQLWRFIVAQAWS